MTGPAAAAELGPRVQAGDRLALAQLLSLIEKGDRDAVETAFTFPMADDVHAVGFTGAPGVGKSTLIDAVAARLRAHGARVGVLAVDPSSPYTGGALLGDRLRMMRHIADPGVFVRSLANRGQLGGLAAALPAAVRAVAAGGFTTVLIETVGVGQGEVEIARHADTTVVVTAPGMGYDVQTSKAGVLEIADVLVVNKADRSGVEEAARDLRDMLHLRSAVEGGWQVPVLLTRADTEEGADALVQALGEHLQHTSRSGELERRRAERSVATVRLYALSRLVQRFEDVLEGHDGRRLVEQVTSGALSPAAAAERLVGATTTGQSEAPASMTSVEPVT